MTLNLETEIRRTNPDYVVFCPPSTDRATLVTGNEHLLVERNPCGGLFAVWTQSSHEGASDQHIAFSRSLDVGKGWSAPMTIVGPDAARGVGMASWAFPIVAKSGRLWVFYSRHQGVNDVFTHTTGKLACIVSDDGGDTWSSETLIPMPRSIWDHPDAAIPANCIVWQKPIRISDGRHVAGFTRWISQAVAPMPPGAAWWEAQSVVEFLRFENIDAARTPADLVVSTFMQNEAALRLPVRNQRGGTADGTRSVVQEPSIVELPDGRLFCVMRTTLGSPYYTVSADQGETWTKPEVLLYRDGGAAIFHPISPCPIYPIEGTDDYVLFYHNHDGHFLNWTPNDTGHHRRPICLARAAFRPDARQPLWFSEPWYFMDNGGISITRTDLAMYASTTPLPDGSGITLWYPERKFFLLGKNISAALVQSLPVPEAGQVATTV